MPQRFRELRERLLRAGVAPRYVRRYVVELADHWADLRAEEERAGRSRIEAESIAWARLGTMDELAQAMIARKELRSWSVRAPRAIFGALPVLVLAAAWSAALFILWSGWNAFLPDAVSPFGVRVDGFANWYFQLGKAIYFYMPILIGWGIGVVAIRQRLRLFWPAISLILVAWIGGTVQVHAHRAGDGVRHVGLGFTALTSLPNLGAGTFHAAILLAIAVLPYSIWRLFQVTAAAPS